MGFSHPQLLRHGGQGNDKYSRQVIVGLDILSRSQFEHVREDGEMDHDGILRVAGIDVGGGWMVSV